MNKGIYCIKCTKNNKVYIGKSKNLRRRKSQHLYSLRHNSHCNYLLQRDYNCFGEEFFEFIVLEYTDNDLSTLEILYTEKYNSNNLNFGYNIFKGTKPPKYVSEKIKQYNIGRSPSKETRDKISTSLKSSNSPKAKKVRCIETGEVFNCVRDIKRLKGLPNGSISKCCRGIQESCGGYHWEYI